MIMKLMMLLVQDLCEEKLLSEYEAKMICRKLYQGGEKDGSCIS